MNDLSERTGTGGQTTHLAQKISFQQPEKCTLLRQGGIISVAVVLCMFRRKKVSNAGAEINRAHASLLLYTIPVSLFQKVYGGIREGMKCVIRSMGPLTHEGGLKRQRLFCSPTAATEMMEAIYA